MTVNVAGQLQTHSNFISLPLQHRLRLLRNCNSSDSFIRGSSINRSRGSSHVGLHARHRVSHRVVVIAEIVAVV